MKKAEVTVSVALSSQLAGSSYGLKRSGGSDRVEHASLGSSLSCLQTTTMAPQVAFWTSRLVFRAVDVERDSAFALAMYSEPTVLLSAAGQFV